MRKTFSFTAVLCLVFSLLWSRIFYLQLVRGRENRQLAEGNRVKIIRTPAPRGVIFDRNGQVLVRNRPEGREYVYHQALAHVLGYLGEADQEELQSIDSFSQFDYSNFPRQEVKVLIGKIGIEREYDHLLRGKEGGVLVETNALGEVAREIKKQPAQEGESLTLSLDLGLQKKAFQLLKGRKGVVVASQPATGQVLALVSSPSFDPNIFTLGEPEAGKIEEVFNNPDKLIFNRAVAGLYPPGSVFKIVTAVAGLEEEVIDQSTTVEDTGQIEAGGRTFGNWYYSQYGKTEGMVDIVKALKRSNDIFFYKVGAWLGSVKLAQWAKYFGLGQPLGIGLPGEAGGLVPTPQWKKENKLEGWYLGDTFITAIGQGNLQLTPLQVNAMAAVIAAQGNLCQPQLLKDQQASCLDLQLKTETLDLVKEGMKQACQSGGTGWPFFTFSPQVGCKTGTAEFADPQERTHAWFSVFAPWDKPEIVLTVLLEGAGEGSEQAAPVAKELLKYWFADKEEK